MQEFIPFLFIQNMGPGGIILIVLVVLLLMLAVAALHGRDLHQSIVLFIVFGLVTALAWARRPPAASSAATMSSLSRRKSRCTH